MFYTLHFQLPSYGSQINDNEAEDPMDDKNTKDSVDIYHKFYLRQVSLIKRSERRVQIGMY